MIQAPDNNLIVLPTTKYTRNITDMLKRAAIQNLSSVNPADFVSIVGEVISLPKTITNQEDLKGFSLKDIRVGDTAIFSYQVIYDLVQKEPNADPIYRNRLWYEGNEYFVAHIRHIYGVIRDGEIIMINGYVMVEHFEEMMIYVPAEQKRVREPQKCQIMYIGNSRENLTNIDAQKGEYVYFNPKYAQKYQIKGKPFCILQQHQILGKEEKNHEYLEIIQ